MPAPDAVSTRPGALSPARRERDLAALGGRFDVVVVGGGVTGAGVALDAAARGLSVALLERDDLAAGTSHWSSKLVHGGLRYLAHAEFGLARESARERAVLMRTTAPHLVRPLPFLVPDVAGRDVSALAGLGARMGDAVRMSVPGGAGSLPGTRRVPAAEVRRLAAGVRGHRGGVVFWDGQLTDDARLVVALARTAAAYGARVLTGALVNEVDGEVVHAVVDGGPLRLRAGVVVNAAGVWAQRLAPSVRLAPSRGSHLVLPAALLGSPSAALTVPLPGFRSRYVFALPQEDGLVHLGITDEPVPGPVPDGDPEPSEGEIAALLDTVNPVLNRPIGRGDLLGAYAGLRPLVLPASGTAPDGATADLSRRHLLTWDGGVLTVVGGKLTTYRAMAEQAVDAVVARLGRGAARSVTTRLPLVGAAPRIALDRVVAPARLVARYGTEAPVVAALGVEPVIAGRPETVGELRFAVRAEGGRSVADLLDRRTRIGLVPADRVRAVPVAERVLAEELPGRGTPLSNRWLRSEGAEATF